MVTKGSVESIWKQILSLYEKLEAERPLTLEERIGKECAEAGFIGSADGITTGLFGDISNKKDVESNH